MASQSQQDFSFMVPRAYPRRHKGIYLMGLAFLVILFVGYITARSSVFFATPALLVESPLDGALIRGQDVVIRGVAEPKSIVRVNGYESYSGDEGSFEIDLPFQKGYHVLDIRSRNRIGREARVVRRIIVE